jgi:hypothetical protein
MNYKTILQVFVIGLLSCSAYGQGETEVRSFMKSVSVNKESWLELTNKYGTMHITTWDKDSAYVRVELKAYATSDAKLKKMFEGISVNFAETKSLLKVQTDFNQNINMIFENFKGMTSKIISYDSRVEINYYVSVPEYLNMRIDSKYGDVVMENHRGDIAVAVSNGSFKANNLSRSAALTFSFCDATIKSVASGKITASFSEISLEEAGELSISSVSSKYEFRKAGNLDMESRRDKFSIDEVNLLKGNAYFTEFRIGKLNNESNISTRYGKINIDQVGRSFDAININSGYTDVSLEFEENSSYTLEIRHLNTFVVLPPKNIKTEQKTLNQDKKEYITYGTFGQNPGSAKVKIDATRGNIYIK